MITLTSFFAYGLDKVLAELLRLHLDAQFRMEKEWCIFIWVCPDLG
jgi:hypothetical protein